MFALATSRFLPVPEGSPGTLDRCSFGESWGKANQLLQGSEAVVSKRRSGWKAHRRCLLGEVRMATSISQKPPMSDPGWCLDALGFLRTGSGRAACCPFGLAPKVEVVEGLEGARGCLAVGNKRRIVPPKLLFGRSQ